MLVLFHVGLVGHSVVFCCWCFHYFCLRFLHLLVCCSDPKHWTNWNRRILALGQPRRHRVAEHGEGASLTCLSTVFFGLCFFPEIAISYLCYQVHVDQTVTCGDFPVCPTHFFFFVVCCTPHSNHTVSHLFECTWMSPTTTQLSCVAVLHYYFGATFCFCCYLLALGYASLQWIGFFVTLYSEAAAGSKVLL